MMSTESFQPVQLKGEIMDLEFTLDTDHRSVAFSALPDLTSRLINRFIPSTPAISPKIGKGGGIGLLKVV